MSIESHLVSLRTYMEEMTAQQREIIGLLKEWTGKTEPAAASAPAAMSTPAPTVQRRTRKKAAK